MTDDAKRLYRSSDNAMLAGVCGGIGEYIGIDPTLIRLIWVVVTLLSAGLGIVGYVLALVIMPQRPEALEGDEPLALEESLDVKAWAEENMKPAVKQSLEGGDETD